MPWPMSPQPRTPTFLISIAFENPLGWRRAPYRQWTALGLFATFLDPLPAADLVTRGRRRALVALALAAALAAVLAGALRRGSGGGSASTATAKPIPVDRSLAKRTKGGPNFLVVLMDDQDENSIKARYMPPTFTS